jgi:hypothetical protein
VNIDAKSVYPLEHFVAIAPKAMQFSAAPGTSFQNTPFPGQPDANVEVASNMKVGQSMAFKLSGEGMLAEPSDQNGQGQASSGQTESRPGGGLGPPIDAPDPLEKYRWQILAGVAAALIIGGIYIASKQQAANRAARATKDFTLEEDEDYEIPPTTARREVSAHESAPSESRAEIKSARPAPSKLLEGLKEELFELEVEHKQGRISQQEYESTKAALDQTLQRALKRESQRSS